MVQKGSKQIIIKIFCVMVAFALWLYTSNDNNISMNYRISNIPIEIINEDYLTQSGLILLPSQNFSTSLKITGKPSDVYSVKADSFKIVADLSAYALRKGSNRVPISIIKRPGEDINIINDNNMWISVEVDNYIQKTVPVDIKTKGNVKTGFYSEKPVVKPESVVVSGAEQYVSTVTQVITEVDLNNLDRASTLALPLIAADKIGREVKDVKISPQEVEVRVPVDKVKEVGVNVRTTGALPEGFVLKSINLAKSKILVTGDQKELDKITSIDIEPINLSKLKDEKTTIAAKLILPNNIKSVDNNNTIEGEVILDRVIQKSMTLTISPIKLQESLNAKLDNTSVSVVVSGSKDVINSLEGRSIECYVNLDTLGKGEYNLPVSIELPGEVTIVSQSLKNIRVIIEEKPKENTE